MGRRVGPRLPNGTEVRLAARPGKGIYTVLIASAASFGAKEDNYEALPATSQGAGLPLLPVPPGAGAHRRLTERVTEIRQELNAAQHKVKNVKSQLARLREREPARESGLNGRLAAGEAPDGKLRRAFSIRSRASAPTGAAAVHSPAC